MFESNEITPHKIDNPPSNALAPEAKITRRQMILGGAATVALLNLASVGRAKLTPSKSLSSWAVQRGGAETMIAKGGTSIFFKDWVSGQPVVFSHGWPLNADAWDAQMLFLTQHGYRVIAHDRRGHGRSGQSHDGNDLNTYADDLAQLIESLKAGRQGQSGSPHLLQGVRNRTPPCGSGRNVGSNNRNHNQGGT